MTHMQLPDDNALDLDSRNHSCSGAGGNRVMRVCNKIVNVEGPFSCGLFIGAKNIQKTFQQIWKRPGDEQT